MKSNQSVLQKDIISTALDRFHFELLIFGIWQHTGFNRMRRAFLDHFRICIVTKGSGIVETKRIHYHLEIGDLMIIPPHTLFAAQVDDLSSEFCFIDFMLDSVEERTEFINLLQLNEILHFKTIISAPYLDNLTRVNQAVVNELPGNYILAKCILLRVMTVMMRAMNEQRHTLKIQQPKTTKEKLLMLCTDYIDHHLDQPIKVKDLAEHVNYSENYIYKVFMETLQIPCKSYILECRLKKSLLLLKSSDASISKIASLVGFNSVYQFSKAFKNRYGYSPSNYRNSLEIYAMMEK